MHWTCCDCWRSGFGSSQSTERVTHCVVSCRFLVLGAAEQSSHIRVVQEMNGKMRRRCPRTLLHLSYPLATKIPYHLFADPLTPAASLRVTAPIIITLIMRALLSTPVALLSPFYCTVTVGLCSRPPLPPSSLPL
jgi:hypothetical protein